MNDALRVEAERRLREALLEPMNEYAVASGAWGDCKLTGGGFQKASDAVNAAATDIAVQMVEGAVATERLKRDREWSNRLKSQDTIHPDSPDLDVAIAWYVSQISHGGWGRWSSDSTARAVAAERERAATALMEHQLCETFFNPETRRSPRDPSIPSHRKPTRADAIRSKDNSSESKPPVEQPDAVEEVCGPILGYTEPPTCGTCGGSGCHDSECIGQHVCGKRFCGGDE